MAKIDASSSTRASTYEVAPRFSEVALLLPSVPSPLQGEVPSPAPTSSPSRLPAHSAPLGQPLPSSVWKSPSLEAHVLPLCMLSKLSLPAPQPVSAHCAPPQPTPQPV
eukprot:CAMPEP_0180714024 /NCGR_PEP_ID=MMETSP1038_2-20121128/12209_1 /TAXON_ID=632150 /ORGANISM="Azadinium spinosum, Strain 3D9" /LENGTH=107 /DNA_ID=CAMNT_0022746377 /DNA_START=425 /DNA_END=745 /DNA_ORIENTATION=+